jgi:hypothetical protein
MDGQRIDQITRALAKGVTRRSALKGIVGTVGLSASGVANAPAAAASTWCACNYRCGEVGSGNSIQLCKRRNHCRAKLPKQGNQPRCVLDESTCGFSDEDVCYASFPTF